jgi:hypothetical protein
MMSAKKNKILFDDSDDDDVKATKRTLFDEGDSESGDDDREEDNKLFDRKLELNEDKANKVFGKSFTVSLIPRLF